MKQATARKARPADIEVLPASNPDVQLVASDTTTIGAFFGNMLAFFNRATELEQAATQLLADVKKLQAPTNGDEDLRVQQLIKTANAAKKTTEEHWSICQVVSQFHRKLTAKRGIAVQALEQAADITQRHHNRWVDAERRRVQEEEDRLRREEEQRQRDIQEQQARELEAQALKAEEAREDLSDRETTFVDLVFSGVPPSIAAKRAGYKDPDTRGPKMLDTPKIANALEAKRQAEAARKQAEAIRRQPVAVDVERPAMDVAKIGTDRTTWTGEIVDEVAFIHAAMSGKHGIPLDVLQINQVKLSEYARSLHERLDLWPGVRAKKTTRTI